MFEINEVAEAALAFMVLHQDESPISTDDALLVKGILALRQAGMASAQTDWGHQVIFTSNLEPAGFRHFEQVSRLRRKFCPLSETAEELMLNLYSRHATQRRQGAEPRIPVIEGRTEDYRELSRARLLNVTWADDAPYFVNEITEKGISYSRGDFYEEDEPMQIINNNTFSPQITNSANGGNADAVANASASSNVTLESVIDALRNSDLAIEDSVAAERSVKELSAAAETKDGQSFCEALEKVASVAKSSATIAGIVLPFIQPLIGML